MNAQIELKWKLRVKIQGIYYFLDRLYQAFYYRLPSFCIFNILQL